MIIIAILGAILTVAFTIKFFTSGWYNGDAWGDAAMVFGIITVVAMLMATNVRFSTQTLTGYIYSAEDRVGYTEGHIRFSETAGEDVQPSFCAPSGSTAGKQIRELAGSGKKVRITIQPYFYFSNNPFACGTDKTVIEEVK